MPPQPNQFDNLATSSIPDSKDKDIEALQERVQHLTDRLDEERFAWFVLIMLLVDLWIFPNMSTWGAPIGILLLELILIVILAKRFGVEEVPLFLYRVVEGWARRPKDH
jgi:hypothetical protein